MTTSKIILSVPSIPTLEAREYVFKPEVGVSEEDFAYSQFRYDWDDLKLWRRAGLESAGVPQSYYNHQTRERVYPAPIAPPIPEFEACDFKVVGA
jgi:hypothetical protein